MYTVQTNANKFTRTVREMWRTETTGKNIND